MIQTSLNSAKGNYNIQINNTLYTTKHREPDLDQTNFLFFDPEKSVAIKRIGSWVQKKNFMR